MTKTLINRAIELIETQRFDEALPLLRRVNKQDPLQWNAWYLAGQCCRYLNDMEGAIQCLSRAAELKTDEPSIYLSLGIAYQLKSQWVQAVEAFRRAIEIDSDFVLAYNSLALTQKKIGEYDKSIHNYDAGAMALSRRIVKAMQNKRTSPILKHRDTTGQLWYRYAIYAAVDMVGNSEGINHIAWPTGEQAMEEERTEKHAGLYWTDALNEKRETVRLFLPNYFNTFREQLKQNDIYSNLIGNRGAVLELLSRHDEAHLHFDEANEFLP